MRSYFNSEIFFKNRELTIPLRKSFYTDLNPSNLTDLEYEQHAKLETTSRDELIKHVTKMIVFTFCPTVKTQC